MKAKDDYLVSFAFITSENCQKMIVFIFLFETKLNVVVKKMLNFLPLSNSIKKP